MKTFNHVNDIWEALETCTTVDQIYDILDNIPQKFGTWWADVVGENEIEVTNQWWDKYQEDMVVESQIFEVKLELKKEDEVVEMAKANELFKEDEEEIETEDEIEVVEKGDKSSDNPMKRWEMKFDGVLRDLEVDNPCTVFNVVQNRLDSAETFTTAAKTIFYHSESDCLKAETLKIKKLKTFNTPKGFRVKVLVSKNNYIGSRELNDENSTPNGVIASLREVKPVRQPRYSSQLISYDISTISIVLPTTDGRLAEKIAELFKLPITEDTKRAKAYGVPRCVKITIPYDIMDVHFVDYLKSVGRTFEDTQSW